MNQHKTALRQQLRLLRREMGQQQRSIESVQIMSLLEAQPCFQKAHIVLCYAAMEEEVNTNPLIKKWHRSKTLLLPVVEGNHLQLKTFVDEENMQTGAFGIQEPTGPVFKNYASIDLILIPGLGFDTQGGRIGFGRGFYDRLLQHPSLHNTPKWGLAFDAQLIQHIPMEQHDIKMDAIITPNQFYLCKQPQIQ
jgi:5-formyltetrahydrofolate cyclo-ligase